MIPISIYKYKIKGEEIISIKQIEREEDLVVENVDELNEKIEKLDFTGYKYASVFIKEDIDLEKIADVERASRVEKVAVGKIRVANLFLFSGRDKELLKYIEKRLYDW